MARGGNEQLHQQLVVLVQILAVGYGVNISGASQMARHRQTRIDMRSAIVLALLSPLWPWGWSFASMCWVSQRDPLALIVARFICFRPSIETMSKRRCGPFFKICGRRSLHRCQFSRRRLSPSFRNVFGDDLTIHCPFEDSAGCGVLVPVYGSSDGLRQVTAMD